MAVGDVVRIAFTEPRPHDCQTENHVIDDTCYWVKQGTFDTSRLHAVADSTGPLWLDGNSSYDGVNDRIATQIANRQTSSLRLASSKSATFQVIQGKTKKQVRLHFVLDKGQYNMVVTDTKLELEYLARGLGSYPVDERVLVCVSLGEPFQSFRYKLAAAVIPG